MGSIPAGESEFFFFPRTSFIHLDLYWESCVLLQLSGKHLVSI